MKKQILITVSYIAEIEEDLLTHNGQDAHNEEIARPLQKKFPLRMKISSEVTAQRERISSITLDSPHANCTKCASCESWVTDIGKPDYIAGLPKGEYIDGVIYCPQCADDSINGRR